jgi:hypothetical protein
MFSPFGHGVAARRDQVGPAFNRSVGDAWKSFFCPNRDKTTRQVSIQIATKPCTGATNGGRTKRCIRSGRTYAFGLHLGSRDRVVVGSHADGLQSNRNRKKSLGLRGYRPTRSVRASTRNQNRPESLRRRVSPGGVPARWPGLAGDN